MLFAKRLYRSLSTPFQNSNKPAYSSIKQSVSFSLALSLLAGTSFSVHAKTVPEFDATFNVHAIGIDLGESKHTFRCEENQCTLKAVSEPQGLARLLINESSQETIKLYQDDQRFEWQSYEKKAGKDLSDPSTLKTKYLYVDKRTPPQIVYPKKNRSWPVKDKLYDVVSLAYAVQYYLINQQPLINLHLQDYKYQESLSITRNPAVKELEFFDEESWAKAVQYEFTTSKAKVKIWLLPTYHYFPGRVDVYNIQKDKTITLLLQEPPKIR